jgi:hypothetical protein
MEDRRSAVKKAAEDQEKGRLARERDMEARELAMKAQETAMKTRKEGTKFNNLNSKSILRPSRNIAQVRS